MAGHVHRLANRGDIADDTGGLLVVDHRDRSDRLRRVGAETLVH